MQDALAQDRVELIVIIPSGLGDGVEKAAERARGGADLPDAEAAVPRVGTVLAPSSSDAPLLAEQVTAYLEQAVAYRATTAESAEQAAAAATTSMRASAPAGVIAEEAAPMPTAFMVFLSMALYSIFAFTTNISSLIMRVLGRRPLRVRMSASPEPVMRRNIGLSAGLAVIGVLGWAATYTLGVGALGLRTLSTALPLHGVAATALLVYAMVGISVGFLMGQLRMSENASNAVANIGGLLFSFLGGAWLPLSHMPEAVKRLSALTPTYWANQPIREAFQSSSMSAEALAPLYGDIGVCALFAVAITAVGMAVGRARLRSAA
ncbi:ABC transporter permease [Actinomyces timonensis]|uniref:ABC transporter permease n=1 Tax=Actinomyces timonensis TaxID=1288391 RepID=A0AAU8N224_9ACTO